MQTDLLMWKVCNVELGYNETVCDNLEHEEYEDFEDEGRARQSVMIDCKRIMTYW